MTAHQHDRPLLALLIRLGGVAGIAVMAALIKLASERGVHIAEIVFWRQFISIPVLIGWAAVAGGVSTLKTQRPGAHFLRGLYGMVGMVLNFTAVILLPLAEAATINLSTPIWAVLLSVVMLSERVGIWRGTAVIAGFAGIVIIAQPGGGHIPLEGAAVALGGAFMIALISIQIRDLSQTDKPMVIVFWFSVIGALVSAPFLPFFMVSHTNEEWLLILGIGLAGTWGQLMITMALRYGKVSSVIVMDYSSIIWATMLGWLLFTRLPPASTWLGAPLIVAAGLTIAWRERVLAKRRFTDLKQTSGT